MSAYENKIQTLMTFKSIKSSSTTLSKDSFVMAFNKFESLSKDRFNKEKIFSITKSELNKIIRLLKTFQGNCEEVYLIYNKFTVDELSFIKSIKSYRYSKDNSTFTREEDVLLIEKMEIHGENYKKLKRYFNKSLSELKWRYKKIQTLRKLNKDDKTVYLKDNSYLIDKILYSDSISDSNKADTLSVKNSSKHSSCSKREGVFDTESEKLNLFKLESYVQSQNGVYNMNSSLNKLFDKLIASYNERQYALLNNSNSKNNEIQFYSEEIEKQINCLQSKFISSQRELINLSSLSEKVDVIATLITLLKLQSKLITCITKDN